MYYPKFNYELNYIEYFKYNRKSQTYQNYKDTLEDLREDISKVLKQVKNSIILGQYKSCLKKIDLY